MAIKVINECPYGSFYALPNLDTVVIDQEERGNASTEPNATDFDWMNQNTVTKTLVLLLMPIPL